MPYSGKLRWRGTLEAFLRIPRPLYDLVFGREWFRDPALPAGGAVRTEIFEGES